MEQFFLKGKLYSQWWSKSHFQWYLKLQVHSQLSKLLKLLPLLFAHLQVLHPMLPVQKKFVQLHYYLLELFISSVSAYQQKKSHFIYHSGLVFLFGCVFFYWKQSALQIYVHIVAIKFVKIS
jgi:hypothetical protein